MKLPPAGIGYGVSLSLHLGVLAWMSLGSDAPPMALPLERGRASVALAASMPSAKRSQPEESEQPVEIEPELRLEPKTEPELQPALEPQTEQVQRRERPDPVPARLELAARLPIERPIQPDLPLPPERTPHVPAAETPPPPLPKASVAPQIEGLAEVESAPAEASQANDGAEVDTLPRRLSTNRAPRYPVAALQARQEGRVVLRVVINAAGTVESLVVDTSSGAAALDAAAVAAVRNWRFEPARRLGRAVRFEVKIPIRFSIRDALRGRL